MDDKMRAEFAAKQRENKPIIETFVYDYLQKIKDNYYIFKKEEKFGIIDKKNKVILKPIYDEINMVNNSDYFLFIAKINEKYGLIDLYLHIEDGSFILEPIYDSIEHIYNNPLRINYTSHSYETTIFKTKIDDKYGVADSHGNIILNNTHDSITKIFIVANDIIATRSNNNDFKYILVSTINKK